MMEPRTIPTGILGLDLLLGGGIRVLRRWEDLDESATILLRGPPGSGKTVLGLQLAGALARALGADVAYGCVEILPTELAAQHAGLKRADVAERMVLAQLAAPDSSAHFPPLPAEAAECRIYAGTLDIGGDGEEQGRILPALLGLLDEVEVSGGRKRVLVVDSLSDGYHLGSEAPRRLADDLCKLAVERGIVLVLLEETADDRPSVWSFATDVVIELTAPRDEESDPAAPAERQISVRKNRFGPTVQGRHHFDIRGGVGAQISPQTWIYQSQRFQDIFFTRSKSIRPQTHAWLQGFNIPGRWPEFRDCATVVHGSTHWISLNAALPLGATIEAPDIILDFTNTNKVLHGRDDSRIDCGDPFLTGPRLMGKVMDALDLFMRDGQPRTIRRILVGDLKVLRGFRDPEGINRALATLTVLSRRLVIPIVFFDTGGSYSIIDDIADISASTSVNPSYRQIGLTLTEQRTGQTAQMVVSY